MKLPQTFATSLSEKRKNTVALVLCRFALSGNHSISPESTMLYHFDIDCEGLPGKDSIRLKPLSYTQLKDTNNMSSSIL